MFEFHDDRLGQVKVINVTEARSSIASIMADKDSNYVITKNNKPIRVIVSYDFYRQIQKNTATASSRSQRPSESRDPVKGLLQTQTEELKKQFAVAAQGIMPQSDMTQKRLEYLLGSPPRGFTPKAPTPVAPPSVPRPAMPEPAPEGSLTQSLPEMPLTPLYEEGVSPVEPEFISSENWNNIPEPPPSDEGVEEEGSAGDGDREKRTAEHESADRVPEEAPVELSARTPPPRGDYFDTYRKLYETPHYQPLFRGEEPPPERAPAAEEAAPEQTSTQSSLPVIERLIEKAYTIPATEQRPSSNLPSIQDLLSEIDGISLSGDEGDKIAVGGKG
ncbi:MAG: type II toxin-antitoxin system Phd/YefM family antitoxin [Deltaproteobacteria bacterium]|nr:type II toxin-antitoxin system Phd/YefM family antitoxin [Deltaproteobacteria bacterium]